MEHLRHVPPSVVFHHTHHFLVQHQHLSPEPPNDFAFWVTNVLQEDQLGERLAAIDTIQFPGLKQLRDRIVAVIEAYLDGRRQLRTAPPGEEFPSWMRSPSCSRPDTRRGRWRSSPT